MLEQIEEDLEETPDRVLADPGYFGSSGIRVLMRTKQAHPTSGYFMA